MNIRNKLYITFIILTLYIGIPPVYASLYTYGYSLRIGQENKGIKGYEAAFIRYLNDDLSIILLSNVEQTQVRSFHKSLATIINSRWRLR